MDSAKASIPLANLREINSSPWKSLFEPINTPLPRSANTWTKYTRESARTQLFFIYLIKDNTSLVVFHNFFFWCTIFSLSKVCCFIIAGSYERNSRRNFVASLSKLCQKPVDTLFCRRTVAMPVKIVPTVKIYAFLLTRQRKNKTQEKNSSIRPMLMTRVEQ